MKWKARTGNLYGMAILPVIQGNTWIEGEMMNTDYGQFRRRGLVLHAETGELVQARLAIPDTYFSIPATTDTQHGYVTGNDAGEFEFRPHINQNLSPADWRKQYKKACR